MELKGIHAYPDLSDQERRFRERGYQHVQAVDMNGVEQMWLTSTERKRCAHVRLRD